MKNNFEIIISSDLDYEELCAQKDAYLVEVQVGLTSYASEPMLLIAKTLTRKCLILSAGFSLELRQYLYLN